jgi:protein-S-isoprenylcysteine O-methyltransferase Ste14
MRRFAMPKLTLALWLVYLALTFALRVIVQLRMTGRTGLVSLRAVSSPMELLVAAFSIIALVTGFASALLPALQLDGPLSRPRPPSPLQFWLGALAYAGGVTATFVSQLAMGRSWRIGVDADERTELVARGPFLLVRNPIFSSMVLTASGLTLLCTSRLAWLALASLVLALELQVRAVEEPYLSRVHGARYRDYASRVGRFVPGLGRRVR